MTQKLATVNAHESIGDADRGAPPSTAEAIRLDLADAWGEMGAAWGVTPAIAREMVDLSSTRDWDPADRILVATARVHGVPLVTSDSRIVDSELVPVV